MIGSKSNFGETAARRSFCFELASAIGPKQTWAIVPHMFAFGGKADMADEELIAEAARKARANAAAPIPKYTLV
jgi:hypothetical protein